jgi:hypothetical protein
MEGALSTVGVEQKGGRKVSCDEGDMLLKGGGNMGVAPHGGAWGGDPAQRERRQSVGRSPAAAVMGRRRTHACSRC